MQNNDKLEKGLRQAKRYGLDTDCIGEKIANTHLTLIHKSVSNQKPINFFYNNGLFYPSDSVTDSTQWVEQKLRNNSSSRISMPISIYGVDEGFVYDIAKEIDQKLGQNIICDPSIGFRFVQNLAPTLVILGLGLGDHILHALKRLEVHQLILVETDPIILKAFLISVNWQKLLEFSEKPGRSLKIIFSQNSIEATTKIYQQLRIGSPAHLYGAIVWQFYESPQMSEVVALVKENISLISAPFGYYIDEMRQIKQSQNNLRLATGILSQKLNQIQAHAAVIGAGPSLDKSIEHLKRIQSNTVLIACGSALSALLRHEIVPDIYVELETHPIIEQILEKIENPAFFQNTLFFTSLGGVSSVIQKFRSTILFLRSESTSSMMANNGVATLPHSAPMVGNAGAALAAMLGFTKVALFGLDCGFREASNHHSSDSLYFDEKFSFLNDTTISFGSILNEKARDTVLDLHKQVVKRVPSIKGDHICQTIDFDKSADNLQKLVLDYPNVEFYQINESAIIPGAINLLPDEFQYTFGEICKEEIVQNIREKMSNLDAIAVNYNENIKLLQVEIVTLTDSIFRILNRQPNTISDWLVMSHKLKNFMNVMEQDNYALNAMGGSLCTFMRMISQRAVNLPAEIPTAKFLSVSFNGLKEFLEKSRTHAEKLFN